MLKGEEITGGGGVKMALCMGKSNWVQIYVSLVKLEILNWGYHRETQKMEDILHFGISKINFENQVRHKIAFDNLTPLYPNSQLIMGQKTRSDPNPKTY